MYVCMYIIIWHMYVSMYIVIWHMHVCMYIGVWHMKIIYHHMCVIIAAVNVFTPPGEVCSGNTATSSCSRDGSAVEWSYDRMLVIILSDPSDASRILMVDGIDFTVTLIFLNTSLTISNISFIATPAADGKVLRCAGGTAASTATIRVVADGKPL